MLGAVLECISCLMNGPEPGGQRAEKLRKSLKKVLDKRKSFCYHIKVRYGERLYLVN